MQLNKNYLLSLLIFSLFFFTFSISVPLFNLDFATNDKAASNDHCDSCIANVTTLMDFLGDNSTMSELEQALDLACLLLPREDREKCRNFVSNLIQSLESADKNWVEDYTPQQFCSLLSLCQTYCCATPYYPQEIHISVNNDSSIIYVMWITQELGNTPTVKYGTSSNSLTYQSTGISRTYHAGGWNGYIYVVELSNLQPGMKYYYLVGDPEWDWSSATYSFITPPSANTISEYKFVIYGDMGATNAADNTIFWVSQLARNQSINAILHPGDISYADGYAPVFDLFLEKIESIAAHVPYMTAPGNHEAFANFIAYRSRFQMPVQNLNDVSRQNVSMYYSFNYGNVHIISYSFEEDWGVAPDLFPNGAQYQWLENDLKNVNRQTQPWIVMFAHRPIYCTTNTGNRCTSQSKYYRSLIEDLIYQYKVDIVIGAHVHNYERTLPVYDSSVVGSYSSNFTFTSPAAPIYAVVGTGGNKEGTDNNYMQPAPSWSVPTSRYHEWGYVVMTVNGNSLNWDFHESESNQIIDSFSVSK